MVPNLNFFFLLARKMFSFVVGFDAGSKAEGSRRDKIVSLNSNNV